LIDGKIKGKGVKNITGDVFGVERKWWYFKKYIEIMLKSKGKVMCSLAYRFPFKEPLYDAEDLPEISEAEYNEIWREKEEEEDKRKKKLDKRHAVDWYCYFLGLAQQKANITLAYKEHKKGRKIVTEIISIHSSDPIAIKLNI